MSLFQIAALPIEQLVALMQKTSFCNIRVKLKGRAVRLETRKAAALLAYLSLASRECQREVLAIMFWQEGNQQKALANLRRTLS